jgi:23S rRNA (uracil1939-C5)-methyltransferase
MKARIERDIEIIDIGAKGKVIGKKDGIAYLTTNAVPGDIVSLNVRKKRKGMLEGQVIEIQTPSAHRAEPRCAHFDYCGGCSWQNLSYEAQLQLKANRVEQQIKRIGGVKAFHIHPALAAPQIYAYRNKLEFTFVPQGWLTPEQLKNQEHIPKQPALGFHVPGRFDWVLHIDECHLQIAEHNEIRTLVYKESIAKGLPFFDPKTKTGILRNLVLRKNKLGEWMVLLIVTERNDALDEIISTLVSTFSKIKSIWFVYNQKVNDSYADCNAECVHGSEHLIETFKRVDGSSVDYKIGPKSFFQTNSEQAEQLYQLVEKFAAIQPHEIVYDLYTGTGSIALFLAKYASKVIGVEYVPEAIADAKANATMNGMNNCAFFAGDMKDVLNTDFIHEQGRPDVIITDPPRAGMHADVIMKILEAKPKRIVYVSCDPATQARDIALMQSQYELIAIQPVDMFPHTSHVENIAVLVAKN